MESHERAECLSSALVVGKQAGPPGEGFCNLLKGLGLIQARSREAREAFAGEFLPGVVAMRYEPRKQPSDFGATA
jgi:hypothetical protein